MLHVAYSNNKRMWYVHLVFFVTQLRERGRIEMLRTTEVAATTERRKEETRQRGDESLTRQRAFTSRHPGNEASRQRIKGKRGRE